MAAVLPFSLSEHPAAADFDTTQIEELMLSGEIIRRGGKEWIVAKCASAVTSAAAGKAYKWTSRTARTVELATGGTDRPCGVTDAVDGPDSLAVGDYVLLQIFGLVELVPGAAISANNFGIGGTAGKVADGGTTESESVDYCRVLDASTGDETPAYVTCQLMERLIG